MTSQKPIKIAVSGKGGVGKTTIAALLCRAFSQLGYSVLAVDADPDANLASALGFPDPDKIPSLVSMSELIQERTGAQPGSTGSFFKLNPKVDDLPEKIWREHCGIRLIHMGTVKKGGAGCICPESTLLKALMQNLILYRRECIIMDMEAGIEHLGRATAGSVDCLLIVVEPGNRSIETASKIIQLAHDLKLNRIGVIGNKARSASDREFITAAVSGHPLLGLLPYDDGIIDSDRNRSPVWESSPYALGIIADIAVGIVAQSSATAEKA